MRTLEDLSAFKVAATLWDKVNEGKDCHSMKIFVDKCKARKYLLQCPLTESMRDKVIDLIDPIGEELISWGLFHGLNNLVCNKYSSNDCAWTINGTIDRAETAKRIIEKKKEDFLSCYKLACINCLESLIPLFWNQLEESEKSIAMNHRSALVTFWSLLMSGRTLHEMIGTETVLINNQGHYPTINHFGFRIAADTCNEAAVKYFFGKLDPCDKKDILEQVKDLRIFKCRDDYSLITDGLFIQSAQKHRSFSFLFCLLNKEQKSHLNPFTVLKHLMYWPYTSQFMDAAQMMYPFLIQKDYNDILDKITSQYYLCNHLFENFWNSSPLKLRQGIRFERLERDNLTLIFKDKKRGKMWIIFQVMSFAIEPFSEDYGELFKCVLSCCCSTENDLTEVKEASLYAFRKKCGGNNVAEVTLERYFNL